MAPCCCAQAEQQVHDRLARSRRPDCPVGSSARRIAGRGAAARASATRCCSPPESWRGIMVHARAQAHRGAVPPRRGRRRPACPPVPAGVATFSSAVIVGMRWKDWNTTPILPRRKRASASSSSAVRSWPSARNPSARGALQPAHQHEERRLARPRRPDQPHRLALVHVQRDALAGSRPAPHCPASVRRASRQRDDGIRHRQSPRLVARGRRRSCRTIWRCVAERQRGVHGRCRSRDLADGRRPCPRCRRAAGADRPRRQSDAGLRPAAGGGLRPGAGGLAAGARP